mmetsp:Transcript_52392/g.111324  ORF Transcript_52392/g.111324 Transcript_52392/m.111324 type:complete len:98 (-) Transcript_52392:323-616(-)|eukprot:CAMPEP_0172532572 /NCGR_PEP_ID=MMETSP1067-20121228/5573_1 /TAXON_ID=265564 ORGANISM="Thalassiosira punctigera, Strain Tpunct2005C2" /NCGR_SAMPLE_ID=MMETSP1067 /ASSEMBLY_ACC=CAM_ASM_000444 /LENGTH=97 /DNA_ID=CAMNT_0013317103 /DNA_START=28 /DNA_END=321 /DNA_ORIENTATION=+
MAPGDSGSALELERIQRECASMVKTLKSLHEEESQLREANRILAQRAVLMGCTAGLDGGTRRGARRKAAAKKAANSSKPPTDSSSKTVAEPSMEPLI